MKYIDSSAFAKGYSVEESERGVAKVKLEVEMAKAGQETLFSSILLIGEVVSAFDKWYRKRLITAEEYKELLSFLVEDITTLTNTGGLVLEPISPLLFISCVKFITKYHISVGDAIHLYTALMHLPRNEEFISSDYQLNEAAKAEGFTVINPEEA